MPPERDPHWQAAFAELHRRRCAEAPALEAMRARAERAVRVRVAESPRVVRLGFAAAGLALLALGWGAWLAWTPPEKSQTVSPQRVEQLLAAIEEQLDLSDDFTMPEFPTDILLTQNQTDPSP